MPLVSRTRVVIEDLDLTYSRLAPLFAREAARSRRGEGPMNFDLSDDQRQLRDLVRDFARDEIAPKITAFEDQHVFPREIIQ